MRIPSVGRFVVLIILLLPCHTSSVSALPGHVFAPISKWDDSPQATTPKNSEAWLKLGMEQVQQTRWLEAVGSFNEAIRLQPDLEKAYVELAKSLEVLGRNSERIAALSSAAQLLPTSTEVSTLLRQALIQAKRYDDAVVVTEAYLAAHPNDAMALADMGAALSRKSRFDDAASYLERAVASGGSLAWIYHELGYVYSSLNRSEDALQALDKALELEPSYWQRDRVWSSRFDLLWRARGIDTATAEVEKTLAKDPRNAEALFARARLLVSRGDYAGAAVDLNRAKEAGYNYSKLHSLYYNLAYVYSKLAQPDDAVKALRRSIELKPDYYQAHGLLSSILANQSQCEEALEEFEKAMNLKPDDYRAYLSIVQCLLKLGRSDEAEKAAKYAIELDPEASPPRDVLVRTLMNSHKLAEAEIAAREFVRRKPGEWNSHGLLGFVLSERNKLPEAEKSYRKALLLQPGNPLIQNNLGYNLAVSGERLPEAVALIESAVKASPGNAAYRDSLGFAYWKAGRLEDAERELVLATKVDSSSKAAFEHLGDTYLSRGKYPEALTALSRSLELAADEETRERLRSKLKAVSEAQKKSATQK
jgi:Flp pilus assembly protein TadD